VVSITYPLRPYYRFYRPEPLPFLPSSSSIVLTRLSSAGNRTWTSGSVARNYVKYHNKKNSVVLVRERTLPTEGPPLVGEVSAKFLDRGCHVVSVTYPLRPYSRFSRPEPLLFLPSSSSIVLTRLSSAGNRTETSGSVARNYVKYHNKKISVVLVRERTIPTERSPLVGEVNAKFLDRGCHVVSVTYPLRPYSRFSRPESLLFLPSSSSVVLTRLSSAGNRTWNSGSVARNSDL
jgi:hypothetical protein